jgi:hypothetical protein
LAFQTDINQLFAEEMLTIKKKKILFWLILGILLFGLTPSLGLTARETHGWAGKVDGSWLWQLPNTPNGLKPTESWHATGASPEGDIYIGGMDHVTNSALYHLESSKNTLRYVGDARSASEAVNNWKHGETSQKFHTRPLWYGGKLYVATMDHSNLNDEYLSRRGFHWYAYDPLQKTFTDLSASEQGGISAKHVSIVSITADPKLNVLYAAAVPTSDIYKYDLTQGKTEKLGRPNYDRQYPYTGRVMWVDSRNRLYFSAGNSSWGNYDPTIYNHIYYYDPVRGFGELKNWQLQETRAIELGQCLPERKVCFFSDDRAHIYRFDDAAPSWSYIGQVQTVPAEILSFNVSADGKKAYIVTSSLGPHPLKPGQTNWIYEFDLTTKATQLLSSVADIDPKLMLLNRTTGYDAWDSDGRFYFSSFSSFWNMPQSAKQNVIVTRIDPVRLKVALGLLPSLTEITVKRTRLDAKPAFVFTRSGSSTQAEQEVLYKIETFSRNKVVQEHYNKIVIPAGASSVTISSQPLNYDKTNHSFLSVIPNGNNYIVGAKHQVRL